MNKTTTRAHIITHTHWDREWFLTSIYTSHWIAGLIDKLEELSATNPDFQFLLDGQTLIIEDLIDTVPAYRDRTQKLIQHNNLLIGPYYCQPDWQMTHGEALLRNLQYGINDVQRMGGEQSDTGWLVDTFGHITQTPQIHSLFGIKNVFVWRGMPELIPYFQWEASNGDAIFGIDLFGGYRNLYGLTHAPEIAVQRLTSEVNKLRPFYPTPDMPLFDGYDLEDSPEDPVTFYKEHAAEIPANIDFQAATPRTFARDVQQALDNVPHIRGELNSGKYGATFPGTFSARAYLKLMARDSSYLLYQVAEPLAAMADLNGCDYDAAQYERWSRALLQNAVHDCICGVSIDQVHEKMAYTYRRTYDAMQADVATSLNTIMQDFAPGTYAVSTNPFYEQSWLFDGDTGYAIDTKGVGVWPITETCPIDKPNIPTEGFQWTNDHYSAQLNKDGSIAMGKTTLGRFVIVEDRGDTYSDDRGDTLGTCQITSTPIIEQQSTQHCVVYYPCAFSVDYISITAGVRITFDQSPLVRWTVDLDSEGTDFQVDMVFESNQQGQISAGMPFDVAKRDAVDKDLLPRELDETMASIMLGQREIGEVRTFPFHDFVSIANETVTTMVMARGIYAYQANDDGQIAVALRRSVEWLTKANLEQRMGDAGPFFYVPDARCERQVRHELAVAIGDYDAMALQKLNASFQNPPIIVATHTPGQRTQWGVYQEDLPLANLQMIDGKMLARVWNPTDHAIQLSTPRQAADVWGQATGEPSQIAPRSISTLIVEHTPAAESTQTGGEHATQITVNIPWRIGENHGTPAQAALDKLTALIGDLEKQVSDLEVALTTAEGRDRYLTQHQFYARKRELFEYRLSVRLNELKRTSGGESDHDYLYIPDPEVAEIGFELNRLRIKRRIYDYVVESI